MILQLDSQVTLSVPLGLFPSWRADFLLQREMGCTPSKSAVIYTQDRVCRDLETCSTFVPSLKSSVSTPEKPRHCEETSGGRQAFLSVPSRDALSRSVSQSSCTESWSPPGCSCLADQLSLTPCSPTPDLNSDTEGFGTA
ncbi:hypothetical protein D9C73_001760 [Xyrichtys novacula]|uniref:Uncharacterized protein n=1 Tax=Xyrichtys novacula TaxID=13765 RepID=A0AAV1H1F4_XYRNO|nr:hypothetical protein D9C73_001760 [Xyrichtys novacula]